MKIAVLGSGLLGVTTAYELARRGFEVEVLDRQPESGRECSYANGGQLSYSEAQPWATPAMLKKLPGWMLRSDAPLVFRFRLDAEMINWGIAFLKNCGEQHSVVNSATLLRLGLYSKRCLERIRNETGIAFDFSGRGILHIYGTQEEFTAAKKQNDYQAKFGCEQKELSRTQCVELEPALAHSPADIVGGLHSVMDETGDAYMYCNALAKFATERYGVRFHYGVTVDGLNREKGMITSVATSRGDLVADGFVMAMGSYSAPQMRKLGVKLPMYPMKGYSITVPTDAYSPSLSLSDGTHKIVYTRIGDKLRVAGTAELAGYDTSINEKRIAPIVEAAKEFLPKVNWDAAMEKWACLRPSTPDGPPIIGRTPYRNLFINTGHGTLGWTQAAGSAAIVADIMEGKPPEILLQGLTLRK